MPKLSAAFEANRYLQFPEGLFRTHTVKLSGKGDLYLFRHHPVTGSKTSYHPGGITKSQMKLPVGGDYRKGSLPIEDITDVKFLTGDGGGARTGEPGAAVTKPKSDATQRKSLVVDWTEDAPRIWGVELWAYRDDGGALLHAASVTPPFPTCEVVATLEVDTTVPKLLLKVWRALDDNPYRIFELTHKYTGERFIRTDPSYVGTPFDRHGDETTRWLPTPLPREAYGPDSRFWHPAYYPDIAAILDDDEAWPSWANETN